MDGNQFSIDQGNRAPFVIQGHRAGGSLCGLSTDPIHVITQELPIFIPPAEDVVPIAWPITVGTKDDPLVGIVPPGHSLQELGAFASAQHAHKRALAGRFLSDVERKVHRKWPVQELPSYTTSRFGGV